MRSRPASASGSRSAGRAVGRLVDRHGQRAVLPWCLAVTAVGIVALLLMTGSGAPGWTLLLPTLLVGSALPPLGSCVRARWTYAVGGRPAEVSVAMALESVADEAVFVAGPGAGGRAGHHRSTRRRAC